MKFLGLLVMLIVFICVCGIMMLWVYRLDIWNMFLIIDSELVLIRLCLWVFWRIFSSLLWDLGLGEMKLVRCLSSECFFCGLLVDL